MQPLKALNQEAELSIEKMPLKTFDEKNLVQRVRKVEGKLAEENKKLTPLNYLNLLHENPFKWQGKTLATYKRAFKKLLESYFLPGLPTELEAGIIQAIVSKCPSVETTKPKYFPEYDYLCKLRASASEKASLFIDALFESGARISEVLDIPLEPIANHTSRFEFLVQAKGYGKNGKTKQRQRSIFLNHKTYHQARELYPDSKKFLFERNGKKITRQAVFQMLRRAEQDYLSQDKKTARDTVRLSPHAIRRATACYLVIQENANLYETAQYLGHSVPVLEKNYLSAYNLGSFIKNYDIGLAGH